MYIIDERYFIKELRIPNTSEVDVDGSDMPFTGWMDQYARLYLQETLGASLFNDLDSDVTDGILDAGAQQKWLDLVNGVGYSYNGIDYVWKGLIFTEGTFKGSVIAYYVYCEWLKFQLSQQTGLGESRGEAVNSMSANSTHRYVSTWNTFVKMHQGVSTQTSTMHYIKGVPFYDYFGNNANGYVSLIEFLKHNEVTYPGAALKCYNYQNTFGL